MSLPDVIFDPTLTIVAQKSYARFLADSLKKSAAGATSTHLITAAAHGLSNGQIVLLEVLTGLTGLTDSTFYYVVTSATDTFQLSATKGGSAILFTADGTANITPVLDLVGKASTYDSKFDDVRREVPDSSGMLRADRIIPIRQAESFKFEIEEVKWLISIFGNLSGFKAGRVQLWITDPDDAASTSAIKTSLFKCIAKLEGGVNFKAGEVSKATIMFEATEKVTATADATA